MSSEIKEQVRVDDVGGYKRGQRVVEINPPVAQVLVSRIIQIAWLLVGVVDLIITARFILLLLNANPANGFVDFIYDLSGGMVSPFNGIIASHVFDNGAVFDVPSLIAIIVYTLVAAIAIELFRIVFAGTGRARHVTTIERNDY